MYQAAYFDRRANMAYIRDDRTGGWETHPHKPVYYRYDKEGMFKTLNGFSVTPCNQYDKYEKGIFEKDIDPTLRILTDLYLHEDQVPTTHNAVFIDIETQIGGALTRHFIESSPMPIISIALYDKNSDTRYVLIVDKHNVAKPITKVGKIVHIFKTEREMLKFFIDLWRILDPTLVITWNGEWFDMPYLFYRIKMVVSEQYALKLSPLGIVEKGYWEKKGEPMIKQPTRLIKIAGLSSLDYLLLYKKFIPKKQTSYKLDYIGKKEVEMGKISYKGNLNDLYKADIEGYINYNLNDVDILIKLDEKLKFIELTLMICHTAHTIYENVYYSSLILDGAIYTFLKKKGIVSPNKPVTDDPRLRKDYVHELIHDKSDNDNDAYDAELENKKFKGAYVKEPITGRHVWLTDEDLARLYPSNIQTLNIGMETMLCRVVNEPDDLGVDDLTLDLLRKMPSVTIESPRGKITHLTTEDFVQTVLQNNYSISGNGIVFRTDFKSAISEVLESWNDSRNHYKNLMKEAMEREDHDLAAFYDTYQQVFKVFCNSIYGCLALFSFRYTDHKKWLSTATTLTGQVVIKTSIDFVNKKFNEELGTNNVDYIVACDTDSMYILCFPIIKHRNPDIDINDEERIIPILQKLADELRDLINESYNGLALEKFNCKTHLFEIKPEYTIRSAFWSGKKKYALLLIRKEGKKIKPGKEYDYKGLDMMKASFPVKYKEFCEKMYQNILHNANKTEVDEMVLNFKEYVMKCPITEAVLPARINEIDKYVDRPPLKGTIFSQAVGGTQSHIRSAIYYNDWVTHKGLDKEYQLITGGDSIYYTYLKPNPFNLDVLGFQRDENPDVITDFIDKYGDRTKNYTSQLLNKIQDVYDKMDWGKPILEKASSEIARLKKTLDGKQKTPKLHQAVQLKRRY